MSWEQFVLTMADVLAWPVVAVVAVIIAGRGLGR